MAEPTRRRFSGILVHPTSLPGPSGSGDLGPSAHAFVDWLVAAKQQLWQVLPLGPTGYGHSPYAARSAFAGNPLLISLERLREDGLLGPDDLAAIPHYPLEKAHFDGVLQHKLEILRKAAAALGKSSRRRARFAEFCERHAYWLEDYALFMAVREAEGGRHWNEWPRAIAAKEPEAVARSRAELAEEIAFQRFLQFVFFEQWGSLRRYANEQGVQIIGDIPIFVAYDSADVWANRRLFHLNERGRPTVVAGVPPDFFSKTGQLWGNPLYDWQLMAREGYAWWMARFYATLELVDIIRIDHFRGFESYWEIPGAHRTAERGRWAPGPGAALFQAARAALGELTILVEDLGTITPAVEALRDTLGYPGMAVLQFAFGGEPANPYLSHNLVRNQVVYTGTHDNATTAGWFAAAEEDEQDYVRRYLAIPGEDIAWELIRVALASVCDRAVIPIQDVLGLGNEARMNTPGTTHGNWEWRLTELPDPAAAERLAELTELYGRTPDAYVEKPEVEKPEVEKSGAEESAQG
jgi:4-alpha-glucanotransferase